MSIAAINWALQAKTGSPTTKLVLIKLADNANDDGECFPSQSNIAGQCELSIDSVSRHIKKLEEMGLVSVFRQKINGVKQRNHYTLNLRVVPAESRVGTRRESSGVPAESRSKPPIEPPSNLLGKPDSPLEILKTVLSTQTATDVIDHRKKKYPLTPRAAKELVKGFANCRDGPEAAAAMMIKNGWRGFEAEWYDNAKRNSGNGNQETAGVVGVIRRLQAETEGICRTGPEPDLDRKRLTG